MLSCQLETLYHCWGAIAGFWIRVCVTQCNDCLWDISFWMSPRYLKHHKTLSRLIFTHHLLLFMGSPCPLRSQRQKTKVILEHFLFSSTSVTQSSPHHSSFCLCLSLRSVSINFSIMAVASYLVFQPNLLLFKGCHEIFLIHKASGGLIFMTSFPLFSQVWLPHTPQT